MSRLEDLLANQNSDGGWSYRRAEAIRKGSWTEPTVYALMALLSGGHEGSPEAKRACEWLRRCQRSDGGMAPRESVEESTWLTALVLLLPAALTPAIDRQKAEAWVVKQTGRESGWINRLRMMLLGVQSENSISYDGWPWYPDAAAWVTPTAISILALEKLKAAGADTKTIDARVAQARSFLLIRRCRDGGWNHGSTKALGYDSDSYPESTGLALLALHGASGPEVEKGITVGQQHLSTAQSPEAISWLQLGLSAHHRLGSTKAAARASSGQAAPAQTRTHGETYGGTHGEIHGTTHGGTHGGTMEIALGMIADAALEGRNVFLPDVPGAGANRSASHVSGAESVGTAR